MLPEEFPGNQTLEDIQDNVVGVGVVNNGLSHKTCLALDAVLN